MCFELYIGVYNNLNVREQLLNLLLLQGYVPQPAAGTATAPNPAVPTAQYPYQGGSQPGYFPPRPGYYFPRGPPPGSYDPTRLPAGPQGGPFPPGSSKPYGSAAATGPRGNPSRR